MTWPTCRLSATRAGPESLQEGRRVTVEAAADTGTGQVDCTVLAGAGGGEPAVEERAMANLQAMGVQAGA
jgi:hypothetical protein